jgi:membrane protein DedA with SNARE-associated domain
LTWHATIIVLFVVLVAGGVGLPFPEDLTLLGAGTLAQPGLLRLTDVVLAGFAGVVTAYWILYGIGRASMPCAAR